LEKEEWQEEEKEKLEKDKSEAGKEREREKRNMKRERKRERETRKERKRLSKERPKEQRKKANKREKHVDICFSSSLVFFRFSPLSSHVFFPCFLQISAEFWRIQPISITHFAQLRSADFS